MANYSLVSNALFRPFTFQEMNAPLEMYRQYYRENEDLANAMAELSAEIGSKLNQITDKDTYKRYKEYSDKLSEYSDKLLRQGMTPTLRSDIQKMRRRYASEIVPIKSAYDWRLKLILEQLAGKAKGMVYENDAATTSLEEYIKNPNLIYGSADTAAGMTRVGSQAAALAKRLRKAQVDGKFDNYTKRILTQYGYDGDDVNGTINQFFSDFHAIAIGQKPSTPGENLLYDILDNEREAAGISGWSESKLREYMGKVAPALYQSIGQETATLLADTYARKEMENLAYIDKLNILYQTLGFRYDYKSKTWQKKQEDGTWKEASMSDLNQLSLNSSGKPTTPAVTSADLSDISVGTTVDKKLAGYVDTNSMKFVDKDNVVRDISDNEYLLKAILNNPNAHIRNIIDSDSYYTIYYKGGGSVKVYKDGRPGDSKLGAPGNLYWDAFNTDGYLAGQMNDNDNFNASGGINEYLDEDKANTKRRYDSYINGEEEHGITKATLLTGSDATNFLMNTFPSIISKNGAYLDNTQASALSKYVDIVILTTKKTLGFQDDLFVVLPKGQYNIDKGRKKGTGMSTWDGSDPTQGIGVAAQDTTGLTSLVPETYN